ncbi:MAG: tetrathionate reductase subunit TtrA, partial [Comamonas sp.]|nr:tetrathionate reductase subunit TtrA [Comamonas sp.]
MTDKKLSPEQSQDDANVARRRLLLRGGAVAGGLAAFAAGYGETVAKGAKGLITGSSGKSTQNATRGNSLTPEFRIDPVSGKLSTQVGQVVSPSSCLGCWTQCGVRVRDDTDHNQIIR